MQNPNYQTHQPNMQNPNYQTHQPNMQNPNYQPTNQICKILIT
jgi:hypothetical protein